MTDREDALELALRAAGMGTWVWRRDTDSVVWDARMDELFGVERGSFGGTFPAWAELVHPDDRAETLGVLEAAIENKCPFNVVHRVTGPRAVGRWIESWGKVFADDVTGEVTGARGVAVDVTERRLAEERVERVRERLALLAHSGLLLASSLELDQTLKNLGRVVVPLLADACEVVLTEGGRLQRYVIAIDDDLAALRETSEVPDDPRHPFRRVLASGKSEILRIDTAPQDFGPPELATSARALGVTVAVVEPITLRGDVKGVFAISWSREPADLDERAELVQDLAHRAALAIENARLFQAQRGTSITLQRALLPDDVALPPGYGVATRYHPGHAGFEVGGDWYDATVGRSGYLQASVGDVVGKGVVAAAAMGRIRTALRTLMFDRAPAQAMTDLADHPAVASAGFVTVLATAIRLDGRARISCAGHLPPLLVTPDGEVEILATFADPALGVRSSVRYREIVVQLEPRSRLVMFTDGLVERRRASLDDGIARLVEVVHRACDAPIEDLADEINGRMLGPDAHDDAALMILELPSVFTGKRE